MFQIYHKDKYELSLLQDGNKHYKDLKFEREDGKLKGVGGGRNLKAPANLQSNQTND